MPVAPRNVSRAMPALYRKAKCAMEEAVAPFAHRASFLNSCKLPDWKQVTGDTDVRLKE